VVAPDSPTLPLAPPDSDCGVDGSVCAARASHSLTRNWATAKSLVLVSCDARAEHGEGLKTGQIVALHQDALRLADDISAGQRGLELRLGCRAEQGDGGMLGHDVADRNRLVGERVSAVAVEVQRAQRPAVQEEPKLQHATHTTLGGCASVIRPALVVDGVVDPDRVVVAQSRRGKDRRPWLFAARRVRRPPGR
jgi:hypothetical protein